MILLLSLLATYGITTALLESDGPFGAFVKLRHKPYMAVMRCFICTSVWIGALISIIPAQTFTEFIIYTFGFSGGAILIHKMMEK